MLKSLLTVVSYSSGDSGPWGWVGFGCRVQGSTSSFKFRISEKQKRKSIVLVARRLDM